MWTVFESGDDSIFAQWLYVVKINKMTTNSVCKSDGFFYVRTIM